MRRALIVGINGYATAPLYGCVRDAISLSTVLETNGDGSPNFSTRTLTSESTTIDSIVLSAAVDELFSADADVALFYFSGHGNLNSSGGTLVTQEPPPGIRGMPMTELIAKANSAHKRVKSTIIILDCCHSGAVGEAPSILADDISAIGKGVIFLSASHRDGYAMEAGGRGVFTDILIEGLQGGASDILGNITPAAVYSLVDQTLGPWDQRPIFKANVQAFVSLRSAPPKIPLDTLRMLPVWFKTEEEVYPLDPQHEPDRENVPEAFRQLARDPAKENIFKQLQNCNRYGLVTAHNAEHMYYAAINSTGCSLTALGRHYRKLAELRRI
ncbi:MAG: caspase family protein [Sphingobium sp.]|nr:caspase family protein [Sphingobium sp.]